MSLVGIDTSGIGTLDVVSAAAGSAVDVGARAAVVVRPLPPPLVTRAAATPATNITDAAIAIAGTTRTGPNRRADRGAGDAAAPPRAASSTALAPRGVPRSASC